MKFLIVTRTPALGKMGISAESIARIATKTDCQLADNQLINTPFI
jgi:hypothetical protein